MNKLGIFDSGLGGYTILNQIQKVSSVDIIFLADQANLPYGSKTKEELIELLIKDMQWFLNQGVTTVLLACNTASTLVEELRKYFPMMEIKGVIDETVLLFSQEKLNEVLVLATPITIASNQYQAKLKKLCPTMKVNAVAMKELASMVEDLKSTQELNAYFDTTLQEYRDKKLPILLGCTHYSLIAKEIENYIGGVSYNSDQVMNDLMQNEKGNNNCLIYTTKDPENLKKQLKLLFDQEVTVLLTSV